jgi:hypothetical protein
MRSQNFIFSEKRRDRILRHILFWVVWGGYFMLMHMASPMMGPEVSHFRNVPFTATESFLFLLLQVPITYLTLYFLLPMYVREKKLVKAIAWFVACWVIYYFLYQFILKNAIPKIVESVLPGKYLRHTPRAPEARFYMGLLAVFVGGFSSTAFVAGFKYLKQWYLKEQRNIQLQRENTEAQLQLLTAQVHPHFLFNTLNNIYSQAQEESARGSKMIMGLSDLLRYILLEGKKPLVPLEKELQMIKEYMHLEKNRYGDKFDLHYLIADTTNDLYIAPLLLLPFIENCFRYGVREMPEDPWINLTIEIKNTTLSMKLLNGTIANGFAPHTGKGLTDVQQRLELLYKDRYDLHTRDDDEVFIVDLKVELVKLEATNDTINKTIPGLLYA